MYPIPQDIGVILGDGEQHPLNEEDNWRRMHARYLPLGRN
jgi:hypothetical protein